MFRSRRSRTFMLSIAAAAVLSSACVDPDPPGVAVDKVSAKLVFGVKEEKPAPPMASESLADYAADSGSNLLPLDFSSDDDFDFPLPNRDPGLVGECPKARPGTPINPPTETEVTDLPREGVYQWHFDKIKVEEFEEDISGQTVRNHKDVAIESRIRVERAVRRVKLESKAPKSRYSFEVVEPAGKDLYMVSQYVVRRDAEPNDPPPAVGALNPPRVGEPDRGLVLTKRYMIDKDGKESDAVRAFEPASGLLILPLPQASNEEFSSSAVDRNSGDTIISSAKVGSREVVDACGRLTSGWAVTASDGLTESTAPHETHYYLHKYVVATQYGALIVRDRVAYRPPGEDYYTEHWAVSLAKLDPTPLPEKLK